MREGHSTSGNSVFSLDWLHYNSACPAGRVGDRGYSTCTVIVSIVTDIYANKMDCKAISLCFELPTIY